ncbi:MAG: glycoside hydrolase family 32 protein [Lachnospiraceae bacterium]|nr:glycoside hydrolase family 32 protein [Lachnospiraceae bacterium]
MYKDKLEQANEYIKINKIPKDELPVFHAAPYCGWMNDPNGFSVYQGKIHLFYQHNPYDKDWGSIHWGHCETEDFIKWKDLPAALAPDMEYDGAGCFSGSAIETKEGHVLMYTGVMKKSVRGFEKEYQNQCLAVGNGLTYTKSKHNPVVTGDMMPEGFNREHFRDPKIWREEDAFYMVAGNKTVEGVPQIVLFRSEDLREWQYVSVLAKDRDGRLGTMWECPDFFYIDGRYVLIASPQDMRAHEEFHNGNNAVYFMGEYDKNKYEFDYREVCSLDDGLDFYAPQTTLAPDGRRIMIAWMQSWDSNIRPAAQKWSCMMTLPRELRIVDGKLLQSPVREIENYFVNPVRYDNIRIEGKCILPGIKGRVLDLTVEIADGGYNEFSIHFAMNEMFGTALTYYREKNMLEIDRTYSGMVRDAIGIRRVKVKGNTEKLKLRLILDKYSAEVFVNDGMQVLSTTLYTPAKAEDISFECDGAAVTTIQKYTISVG